MPPLDSHLEQCLIRFAQALVDQRRATIAVRPRAEAAGYWFGGGNLARGPQDKYWLVGRFRNAGDSRTGLAAGERGLEWALFEADDPLGPYSPRVSLKKSDLDVGDRRVLSIEGSALRVTPEGLELFVSTEKTGIGYPPPFESYLKPRTGVWTIDLLAADRPETLGQGRPVTLLESRDPCYLHLKDPVLYEPAGGVPHLLFCSHPYCWSSSNSGWARRASPSGDWEVDGFELLPRGAAWDVAMTRVTAVLDIPPLGAFADRRVSLVFYDGGECVRNLEEHGSAVRRPRGYSCEELGGAGYFLDGNLTEIHRLSRAAPLFVSPYGTGCSRYVDVLDTGTQLVATWQQSQPDGSQPLVVHALDYQQAAELLAS